MNTIKCTNFLPLSLVSIRNCYQYNLIINISQIKLISNLISKHFLHYNKILTNVNRYHNVAMMVEEVLHHVYGLGFSKIRIISSSSP